MLQDAPELVADNGSHGKLLAYVAIALGSSFLCSVWEAVLLATPRSHVALMVQRGAMGGKRLQRMRRNIERPISAILTLNTVAHTVGAAGAGAEATLIFGSAWFGVISAVLTVLILVFSEIIPKTLGTVYCRQLAGFTGVSVHALVKVFYPLVRLLELVTLLFKPERKGPSVTRAELQAMAAISADEGGIDRAEQQTVENLLRLETVKVRDIMTPRTVLFVLPETTTVADFVAATLPPFSRIPVTPGGADDITGYVLKSDVLERAANDEHDVRLAELVRPLDVVPTSASAAHVLGRLADARSHVALVADEYGGTAGLVTLEDVMETLLGREIIDESDRVVDMQELARRRREGAGGRDDATPPADDAAEAEDGRSGDDGAVAGDAPPGGAAGT